MIFGKTWPCLALIFSAKEGEKREISRFFKERKREREERRKKGEGGKEKERPKLEFQVDFKEVSCIF